MPMAEPRPLSSPWIYLIRMGVFLALIGFGVFILQKPIETAFYANPGLNALIFGVLFVGIVLAVRQVIKLFREVRFANALQQGDEAAGAVKPPVLLAPMAALFAGRAPGERVPLATVRALLDSLASRLDENREVVRYLAGLLVFLGLIGTFWGLIETVGSVGRVIQSLRTGSDASNLFDELKNSLAAPLSGMAISFASSLFGLGSSLVLSFLELQTGRAQNRFFTQLEDWLASAAADGPAEGASKALAAPELMAAMNRLTAALTDGTSSRAATQAMANLAEGIQGLVQHMRSEQQMIRDWVEAQAARERELKQLLDRMARERIG
jgi:hypothetical protein